jgi:hypothetical protein
MFPDSWQASDPTYNHAQGIGMYIEQHLFGAGYEGAAARGSSSQASGSLYALFGLYELDLRFTRDQEVYLVTISTPFGSLFYNQRSTKGFRCVYRP